jgi:hypothetical protein
VKPVPPRWPAPARDESGQLAGIEAATFGLLVVVAGVLLVANAWGVIDAKLAVASAAREATRAYVEAVPGSDPAGLARAAADEAIAGFGRDPARLDLVALEATLERCAQVRFQASYPVPVLVVPWIRSWGTGFTASARHTEVVDPYRSGLPPGAGGCGT